MSLEELVRHGRRIDEFLKDEVVQQALSVLESKYVSDFKQATTDAERLNAWAELHALDDFQSALKAVVSGGERAMFDLQQQEENAKRRKAGKPLRGE